MMTTALYYHPVEDKQVARQAFDQHVRPLLRPEDHGKYVAVAIESGEFELDADAFDAAERLVARLPGAVVWTVYVSRGAEGLPIENYTPNGVLPPADDPAVVLARARDILSGRVVPPPVEPPPGFVEYLDREFGWRTPPPTKEAIRFQTDNAGLDYLYRGRSVAVCTLADGGLAVLAVGEREIVPLYRALSDDERSRVVTHDTEYTEVVPVRRSE